MKKNKLVQNNKFKDKKTLQNLKKVEKMFIKYQKKKF